MDIPVDVRRGFVHRAEHHDDDDRQSREKQITHTKGAVQRLAQDTRRRSPNVNRPREQRANGNSPSDTPLTHVPWQLIRASLFPSRKNRKPTRAPCLNYASPRTPEKVQLTLSENRGMPAETASNALAEKATFPISSQREAKHEAEGGVPNRKQHTLRLRHEDLASNRLLTEPLSPPQRTGTNCRAKWHVHDKRQKGRGIQMGQAAGREREHRLPNIEAA